jgi:hypothetical protein
MASSSHDLDLNLEGLKLVLEQKICELDEGLRGRKIAILGKFPVNCCVHDVCD